MWRVNIHFPCVLLCRQSGSLSNEKRGEGEGEIFQNEKASVCLGQGAKQYKCQGGKPLKPEPEGLKKLSLPTLSEWKHREKLGNVREFIVWKEKEARGRLATVGELFREQANKEKKHMATTSTP